MYNTDFPKCHQNMTTVNPSTVRLHPVGLM